MSESSFSLIPFPDSRTPAITIAGKIVRKHNFLVIQFEVMGETESILFPESAPNPTRKDELWKATCFEFFIARPEQPEYWEFNMSPSGDWNAYCMDAYRRIGFREEPSILELSFSFHKDTGCASVEGSVDLSRLFSAETAIQAGIASIIQMIDQHETYWALVHPNPQADFHLRESFKIEL